MPTSARTSGPPASSGRVWAPAPTGFKCRKTARRRQNPRKWAALVAARGRGQAPPLRSILAGRCLPQQTSVGADAHVGPHLRATGQLRAGVGTRPYRLQVPQDSPPETEPRRVRAAFMAARGRGQAPPLWSILAGRYLPQQTSVGADAHVGPPLRATGQLRAGVGTRPYRLQVPQDSPPETEPRKGRAALVAAHSRGRGSAIQIEEAGEVCYDSENRFLPAAAATGRDADAAKPILSLFTACLGLFFLGRIPADLC